MVLKIKNDELLNDKSFRIIEMLAKTISTKTGVSYDLLFSEGINKLDNVKRNYVAGVGKNFNCYLKACMNGYMLNYVRNRSFAVPINRTYIDIYLKYIKYGDVLQTADRLSLKPENVEFAIEKVQSSRNFYELHGNIKEELPEDFQFSKWIINQLEDWEKNLIDDYYINKKKSKEMRKEYGEYWRSKLAKIARKVKKLYGKDTY